MYSTSKTLRTRLSRTISLSDINILVKRIMSLDKDKKNSFFDLLFDTDDKVACRCAWIMTHFPKSEQKYFQEKSDVLIDELIKSNHNTKRRLILSIIYKNNIGKNPICIKLLNYCLDYITLKSESSGIRSLSVKLAYNICSDVHELLQELKLILHTMEDETSPAVISIVKNTLVKINKKDLKPF